MLASFRYNDGAIVAINREAKALGIKRGTPFFQANTLIKQHNIACFSSNYSLYSDLSTRVMTILEALAPEMEIFSIDEAFLMVDGIEASESLMHYGQRIQKTLRQQTGLTCGIGIAQTRTLAKLANHSAKTWPATGGVVDLSDKARQRRLMALLPVDVVWGIGRVYSEKLKMMGIKTVLQLADANVQLMKKSFGVVVERTVRELNGTPCINADTLPARQQIITSRSFGERITHLQDMRQAVCLYAERAAEKLRAEKQFCRHINVFIRTSAYGAEPFYSNNASQTLMLATQDTRDIVAAAMKGLAHIWREGYRYQKAGIMLNDFCSKPGQIDMFDETPPRANSAPLMQVIDRINRTGLGKVWFGGQGIEKRWDMKREMLSPSWTTNWKDLPKAKL
ncbi:translesion error-prone DNA polymerase V subunit UmuC [Yersinia ruckeri]|uniref:translesion error-prone DNA polymerase V subunit UmuC n=1 Tax=Yersinia ruckeri TaxID=29486 RepID=UPI0022351AA0|nr:translesion error-prone DNA polymerase V subunit UmuC [Yersinia ruckeri]UIN02624.1 translesion error-prone DNA polymerase V subunit UmuC [Yersinia ruckeri]